MEALEAEFLAEDPDLDVVKFLIETLWDMGKREKPAPFDESDRKWTSKNWRETFCFHKWHRRRLCRALQLPAEMYGSNRIKWSGSYGLCVVLAWLSYPNQLHRLEDSLGRFREELSVIFNVTTKLFSDRWGVLLQRSDQPWLALIHLEEFAQAVHAQNGSLQNIWGFIDGTVWAISRPIIGQRLMFNGHKRVHSLKFQSVVSPNGLIANLHWPCEGRRHDGFLLRDSGLLDQVQVHRNRHRPLLDGASPVYSVYGDPANPVRAQQRRIVVSTSPRTRSFLTPGWVQFGFLLSMDSRRCCKNLLSWILKRTWRFFTSQLVVCMLWEYCWSTATHACKGVKHPRCLTWAHPLWKSICSYHSKHQVYQNTIDFIIYSCVPYKISFSSVSPFCLLLCLSFLLLPSVPSTPVPVSCSLSAASSLLLPLFLTLSMPPVVSGNCLLCLVWIGDVFCCSLYLDTYKQTKK